MAAQDERESGDIDMGEGLLDPMAQDEEVEQEMLGVEEEQFIPPQMDLEPEMGAAAAEAAVCDTPLPHLRQIPSPTPSETATNNGGSVQFSPFTIAQMMEMITQAMRGETQQMEEKMEGNTKKMEANRKELRGRCRTWVQACRTG